MLARPYAPSQLKLSVVGAAGFAGWACAPGSAIAAQARPSAAIPAVFVLFISPPFRLVDAKVRDACPIHQQESLVSGDVCRQIAAAARGRPPAAGRGPVPGRPPPARNGARGFRAQPRRA